MSNLESTEIEVLPVRLAKMLEREIVVGRLAPGQRITEDLVLERADVSRSPVREAFRILEQDGLVVRGLRRGVRVAPMSISDLDEVYEVRVSLEGLVAAGAARRAEGRDIALLERLVETLSDKAVLAAPERYLDANIAFSQALYGVARNTTLTRLAGGLAKQALRYRFFAYEKLPDFRVESLAGANALLAAIRKGDAELAKTTQMELVVSSWQQIRAQLADTEMTAAEAEQTETV